MEIIGKAILFKLKHKNKGNFRLEKAIDKLIVDLENSKIKNTVDLKILRKDMDLVHPDGFYFFNISIHRTMILIEFDEESYAQIVWAGSHSDYESTFKNNKSTIHKWLKGKGYIE